MDAHLPVPPVPTTVRLSLLLLVLSGWLNAAPAPAQAPNGFPIPVAGQTFPNNQESLTVKGIVDSIRFALVGSPTYHAKQRWEFDPEVARRRNPEFEQLHGHHAVYLVERLGLGIDGRQEERRQQQAIRDIGVPITGKR